MKIIRQLNSEYKWRQILTYDSPRKIIRLEPLENDTLTTSEVRKYNKFHDLTYSLLPQLSRKRKR